MSLRTGRTARARVATDAEVEAELQRLVALGAGTPDVAERLEIARMLRGALGDAASEVDRVLLERIVGLGGTLDQVRVRHDELHTLLMRYQHETWHPAIFRSVVSKVLTDTSEPRVLVTVDGARRIVGVVRELDVATLVPGDEVYLDDERRLVVAASPFGSPPSSDTATLERVLGDGARLLLRWRDELIVADASARLLEAAPREGDLLRWDRSIGMAFERLDRRVERSFLLEEVEETGRDRIGGQDANLERLTDALTCMLLAPERARAYGLGGRQSVLLVGPPGGGKTLLARIAASEIRRIGGQRCRFAVVKPGELESEYVGQTGVRIRALFAELREAARDGHVVLFLDEVESIGRIRGGAVGHHDDKALTSWLTEIDGFGCLTNVAIVAATNRHDLLDPALYERLSDLELHVGRPDMAGARRIFEIHLGADVPYAASLRDETDDPRAALVELAVARLWLPNAGTETHRLRFRDGSSRTVSARELLSGRAIEQLCRAARASAFRRELRGGEPGVARIDVEEAVAATLERLGTLLTPHNCRALLSDLQHDRDVVRIDALQRASVQRHRYRSVA